MRTAEEYYEQYTSLTGMDKDDFTKVINEARIEAIRECAKEARSIPFTFSREQQQQRCPAKVITKVDQNSILKLIDQIK